MPKVTLTRLSSGTLNRLTLNNPIGTRTRARVEQFAQSGLTLHQQLGPTRKSRKKRQSAIVCKSSEERVQNEDFVRQFLVFFPIETIV